MPSWQSVTPPKGPHSTTGVCWCGYVTGKVGVQSKPTAGLYGRSVAAPKARS